IQVPNRDGSRSRTRKNVASGLKGAIAIPQQHRDVVGASFANDEVRCSVPVKVSHLNGSWQNPDREGTWRLKTTIAVAQQHDNIDRALMEDREVRHTVPIEVSRCDGNCLSRAWPHRSRRLKGAVAVT